MRCSKHIFYLNILIQKHNEQSEIMRKHFITLNVNREKERYRYRYALLHFMICKYCLRFLILAYLFIVHAICLELTIAKHFSCADIILVTLWYCKNIKEM